MKLWYSPTSPYVRKVSVSAHELGLWGRLELIPTNAWDTGGALSGSNPLNKVPTLELDDGSVLYDSPVICEYLDALADGDLVPDGEARWQVLRGQALADGLLDAAVALFIEHRRRAESERSPWWDELQRLTVGRVLDALADDARGFRPAPDLAQVSAGCALAYLDFRFAELDWRSGRGVLTDWYREFAERASMQATVPADPA